MLGVSDSKSSVELVQIYVNRIFVGLNDLPAILVKLLFCHGLLLFKGILRGQRVLILLASPYYFRFKALFLRFQVGMFLLQGIDVRALQSNSFLIIYEDVYTVYCGVVKPQRILEESSLR